MTLYPPLPGVPLYVPDGVAVLDAERSIIASARDEETARLVAQALNRVACAQEPVQVDVPPSQS